MSRTDVPIGIRRSVVQIQIERATISVIVAIAVTIGERALSPFCVSLFNVVFVIDGYAVQGL